MSINGEVDIGEKNKVDIWTLQRITIIKGVDATSNLTFRPVAQPVLGHVELSVGSGAQ